MAETYHEDHKMNKHYLRMFTHKLQMGFEKKFFFIYPDIPPFEAETYPWGAIFKINPSIYKT